MNFTSDNVSEVAPSIMAAIAAANQGAADSYGEDAITHALQQRLSVVFEREVAVFPVATGTAANALALAALTPPWGSVFCHEMAHIAVDEASAPEFYIGGGKLLPIAGEHGKLTVEAIARRLPGGLGSVHSAQPSVVSLTQASEYGTVYRPAEVAAIAEAAHHHGLSVHMDGSRFANAMAHLGCSPAEATWRSGVDVLCFGATKNGALAAEAVVFFDPEKAATLPFRRKRGGHLISKMRFLSAQIDAYLEDDLWLTHAAHANAMAQALSQGLVSRAGGELRHPVEANEIFIALPEPVVAGLLAQGFKFYRWDPEPQASIRLVTGWNTDPASVEGLIAAAAALA